MALAKICGLSTPAALDAALKGGAAFVGFVFFATSPRSITIAEAARLAPAARGAARIVAVTVDPDDELVTRLMRELKPDLVQLHGQESPRRVHEIVARAGVGAIKVVAISEAADLELARTYEGVAEHLLFETRAPAGASRPGGHGESFDWSLLSGLKFERDWFLAGGLDPWNVAEAIGASGAPMVDVSSGVERGPGLKDPALIIRFLAAASA